MLRVEECTLWETIEGGGTNGFVERKWISRFLIAKVFNLSN